MSLAFCSKYVLALSGLRPFSLRPCISLTALDNIILFDITFYIIKVGYIYLFIFYSFTLYPANSRVGRGSIRHCVPLIPLNSEDGMRVVWQNSRQCFASAPERNIKYLFKKLIKFKFIYIYVSINIKK